MKFLKHIPKRLWVILASLITISFLSGINFFHNYELLSYDLRFKLRPGFKASPDIALIQISDDTLSNLGKWPFPRDFYASLIDVLKEKGARMVVLDLLFSEPTLDDAILAKAIKSSGNVFMAQAFEEPKRDKLFPKSDAIIADLRDTFKESCAGIGHINYAIDPDGKARRIPLFIKYNGEYYPQLALKAACERLKLDTRNIKRKGNKVIIDNKLFLPVLSDGSFLVNYPDTWNKSFLHLSYFEVLKAYSDEKEGIKPQLDLSILKDKICFVGLTAAGTSDIRANPLENIYPLLGLQASVFNSIIAKKFISPASPLLNTLINLIVFVLNLIICLHFSPLKAFFSSIIFGLGYFVIATVLFIFPGLWINLFLPLLIIATTYIGSTAYRFFHEHRKRQLLEKELDIAREIQKSFLPKETKECAGINVSSFMQPAKFVAGDLYDIINLKDERMGVFIGDVSGKGVSASLIMAQTISLFRVFANQYQSASEVLNRLNKELTGRFEGRFVTCLYMVVDQKNSQVQVSSAGHAPVLLYRKERKEVSEIELNAGMPLGIMEENDYENVTFDLKENDKVMIFTDGLAEARNRENQEFGVERPKKIIIEHGNSSSEKILKLTKDELFRFTLHAPQHDDITIIVLANKR